MCAHLLRINILEICDKYAPFKLLKLREHALPWLNTEYLSAVDCREHWCRKFRKNPTEYHLGQKNWAIENAKSLKTELKQSYFQEKIESAQEDSKKLWKSIKEF